VSLIPSSYNISLLIAKSGKAHTIEEELILPAIEEVLKTVLHKPLFDKLLLLEYRATEDDVKPKERQTIDIPEKLPPIVNIRESGASLKANTSCSASLLAYVRFAMDEEIHEELLFAKILKSDTKGESIFNVLSDFFTEKSIPFTNIISVAADRAPAMFGRYRGLSHLKRIIPGLIAIHCVIHRQHLVAKNLSGTNHFNL
ncbi:hypothetical protein HUJ04_011272, partial [Dendroctonus ponderosae]